MKSTLQNATIFVDAKYHPFKLWMNECPYTCEVTLDKKRMRTADMALFNVIHPLHKYYPAEKPNGQLWVINTFHESAKYYSKDSAWNRNAEHLKGKIDYVYSYRHDSDVVESRMKFTVKNKNEGILNYSDRKGGDLLLSWFVSNCGSKQRIKYYEGMTNAMNNKERKRTNAYGKCFNNKLKCGSTSNSYSSQNLTCVSEHLSRYKFYLSFENSRCVDYITEKPGVAIKHGAIPIVMGGKNKNEYNSVLPPHSFIHVDDFKSPKELVAYMRYLDKNDTAYNEYFEWQNTYDILGAGWGHSAYEASKDTLCHLCGIANGQIRIPKRNSDFDFGSWWTLDQCL